MVRLFIAVALPAEVHAELARQQIQLRALAERERLSLDNGLKWSDPAGIHLTLKFLGEVPVDRVALVASALQSAAAGHLPLALALAGAGAFPNPRRPRILWVGLAGELAALGELQQAVEREVSPLGYPPEARSFSPHLTLARVREQAGAPVREAVAELVARSRPPAPLRFTARAVCLFQSELHPTGARYTALSSVELQTSGNARREDGKRL